jgi:hypothetical protein
MAMAGGEPPVDVSVTLDPPEIPFHRQARYTIAVEAPADLDVKLPDMISKFGGLAVSDVKRNTQALRGKRQRVSETYVLDAIFATNYRIYPAEVTWGLDGSVAVPSPALRVRDLTPEEKEQAEQFAANAGPISIPNPLARHWRIEAAVAAALLAAIVIVAFLYRRRKHALEQAPPPPAWEVAYQRLRELDQRQLPKAGKYEPYYVDLSAILRYYIEDRFHLHAPEQTTQEFLAATTSTYLFSEQHQKSLAGFLRHSDRVKFAQYVPSVEEMERCFAVVLQFVDETVPRPEPEVPQGQPQEAAA